jgi:tight adherence protein B
MALALGLAFLLLAGILSAGLVVLLPRQSSIPIERRRPVDTETKSTFSRFAGAASSGLNRFLSTRNVKLYNRDALDQADVRLSQADFMLMVAAAACVAALIGLTIGGPALAILLMAATPFLAQLVLNQRAAKRRREFDEQLGDTLHLLTGGLRAGHSILRAIDAAAAESPNPTAQEMRRIVTETSLGRDLLSSLNDTAERMKSEDFVWIAQAIQINREVGGNLAEVLDQVNETIRERSEIKGQIKSLAAEGKFSAYILMAMPFGIAGMLMVVNPGYINKLFTHPLGWVMIAVAALDMTIGGLWMRKIINLKF